MQNSWDARDPNGRIRIMLSEQLITKTASPGEVDLGTTNNIVCFVFQHAPKGTTEKRILVKFTLLMRDRYIGTSGNLVANTKSSLPLQCARANRTALANVPKNLLDPQSLFFPRRYTHAIANLAALSIQSRQITKSFSKSTLQCALAIYLTSF